MGYWWVKLTGLCNVGTAFAGTIVDGAVDCIVVKVVAKDSWDCCGELKVLFARPLYMPSVWVVPALEKPVSECMVSAFVASVGALDLLLRMGAFWTACGVFVRGEAAYALRAYRGGRERGRAPTESTRSWRVRNVPRFSIWIVLPAPISLCSGALLLALWAGARVLQVCKSLHPG